MKEYFLRSKARWASQGEKVSKYFCGLEKRHFVNKQMFKLFSKHDKCLEDTEEMLQETKTFYQRLNSEKKTVYDVKIEDYVSFIYIYIYYFLPELTENEANV